MPSAVELIPIARPPPAAVAAPKGIGRPTPPGGGAGTPIPMPPSPPPYPPEEPDTPFTPSPFAPERQRDKKIWMERGKRLKERKNGEQR